MVPLYNVHFPSLYLDFSLSDKSGAAPTAGSSGESGFLRKDCGRLFYTENGLESHGCFRGEQWHPPQRKEEQQVKGKKLNPSVLVIEQEFELRS